MGRLAAVALLLVGAVGCNVRDCGRAATRRVVNVDSGRRPAPASGRKNRIPVAFPPPEYLQPGPPLVVSERPSAADVPSSPLSGSTEGFRFDARAVLLESKPSGWAMSIYARDVEHEEWFPPVNVPQFHLRIDQVRLGKGVELSRDLGNDTGLWFQSTNEKLAVVSYSGARASFFVAVDGWNVRPYGGRWQEAGEADLRLYVYVEPFRCSGCFKGAQIAGVFRKARVRHFTAPP